MSDFDGGFVIGRAEGSDAETIYRAVQAYLTRIGEPFTERHLVYASARGSSVLWLGVLGGPANGKGRYLWHRRHAGLAAEIGVELRCATWAWAREDQTGSEWLVAFDATGAQVDECEHDFDRDRDRDREGPIAALGRQLGSWEADESTSTTSQALDRPFDPTLLSNYLLGLGSAVAEKPVPGHVKLTVFLQQRHLADATKLAQMSNSDLGTILWAAWEIGKGNACRMNPSSTGALLRLPRGEAPKLASPRSAPPPLDGGTVATSNPVLLFVPKRVEEEVRALAVHADVKYGSIVDYVYGVTRRLLWQGRRW